MEQIITGEGQLVPNLDAQITKSGIAEAGTDYHTVAIIGAQSSGKSTILNLLFGTKFETMNESTGRQQTTKGIHAAKSVDSPILLFDVEGCDSRERGDSDALFERKSALFALALSEILIINMWESDIGRYQASNIPMLKTVFEVNVQLFLAQSNVKSKILFVIRDCTHPNFDAITFQIDRDMRNIWDEIEKPDSLKDKDINDFFDIQFYSVHHMKIQPDVFKQDIDNLRKWFNDSTYEHYLFKEPSSKVVPGEGLTQYIRNLWEVINENKELNIPSQRTMLSRFKCDENAKLALEAFTQEIHEKLENVIDTTLNVMPDFKEIGDKIVAKYLKQYNDSSWRYIDAIVTERETELINEMKAVVEPIFNKQCSIYSANIMNQFLTFTKAHEHTFVRGGRWTKEIEAEIDRLDTILNNDIDNSKISPFDLKFGLDTKQSMTNHKNQRQEELVKNLYTMTITENMREFHDKAGIILRDANTSMWDDLKSLMNKSAADTEKEIKDILLYFFLYRFLAN